MSEINPANLLAASQFIAEVDSGGAAELWGRASMVVRDVVDVESFCEGLLAQRGENGAVESRRWSRISQHVCEGQVDTPDGAYANVVFDIAYADGRRGEELVSLRHDEDGVWRLCGIAMR